MEIDKEFDKFHTQSLVIGQKLSEGEELSREDIEKIVELSVLDFLNSSSLRSAVMHFGKIISHLSDGALKNFQKKKEEKNGPTVN